MTKSASQINGVITINADVSVKTSYTWKKDYVWIPATCHCENGKYLASIMNKTISDEIVDVKETNFDEKKSNL